MILILYNKKFGLYIGGNQPLFRFACRIIRGCP